MCREVRGNLVGIYWILIVPLTVLLIILEFFRLPENGSGAGSIIKRAIVSMILMLTFDDVVNLVAVVSDGVTDKIEGSTKLMDVLSTLKTKYSEYQGSVFDLKETIIFVINLLAYLAAYLGVFVSNALIYFVTGILYCVSPLMILLYCSDRTAFICGNLYKGLLSVMSWKILWSILGVMLLKLATHSGVGDWSNVFTSITINLCIGISMLFIPFFAKSLMTDGLVSMAAGLAAAPAMAGLGAVKGLLAKTAKSGLGTIGSIASPLGSEVKGAAKFAGEIGRFDKAQAFASAKLNRIGTRVKHGRQTSANWIRVRTGLEPKNYSPTRLSSRSGSRKGK